MIDTLAFAERLRAGGADERLAKATAEAVAHALREGDEVRWREMATKADLAELRAATRADLAEQKAELLKWVIGLLLGQTAIIAALVRLL